MRPRYLTPALLAALADTPVVLLHGARQAGKSTLARSLTEYGHPASYLTLDDAGVLSAARHDPQGFLAALKGAVVLDEIQRVPELFLAIKASVDRDPRPGRFLLTGSANAIMLPNLADSLAGRMEILNLWPFSQGELVEVRESFVDAMFGDAPWRPGPKLDRASVIQKLLTGGYPAVVRREKQERRDAWFGSYLTTILQRDIRDLAHIERLTELPNLLALLAARAGSLLNFADVARGLAVPQSTVKRYMALLQTTFLVEYLPAWSSNLGKRLIKAPKVMLTDTGLMAHLLGLNQPRLAAEPMFLGPLLENFVVMELRKQASWSSTRVRLFHFRLATGQEVDILLEDSAGNLSGIDVKASATVSAADFRGLEAMAQAAGRRFHRGVLLYLGTESIPFGPALHALPLPALWAG